MEKFAAMLIAAIVLTGCIFDTSGVAVGDAYFVDSTCDNCNQDLMVDGLTPDISDSDSVVKPDGKADSLKPDALQPDSLQSDTLKPDAKPSCAGVNCNNGSCDPKTGKCVCNKGFAGTYCGKCDYAYGPYPTCAALPATVSIKLSGTSPYPKNATISVEITFSNATTFQTQPECILGCGANPTAKGSVAPPNGPLPTTTTNTLTKYTVQWTIGSPPPADLRLRVFATGPHPTVVEDNKSIAVTQ